MGRWRGVPSRIILAPSASNRCCDARPCPDPADLCDFNELSERGVSPPRLPPLLEVCDRRRQREPVPEVPSAGCVLWGPGEHRSCAKMLKQTGGVWELRLPGKVEHLSPHRGISGNAGDWREKGSLHLSLQRVWAHLSACKREEKSLQCRGSLPAAT